MKTRTIAFGLALVPVGIIWYLGSATTVASAQLPQTAPTVAIPKAYGKFKAYDGGRTVFEAADGTIRIMAGARLIATIQRN